jgi:hypothetical protein
VSGLRPLRGPTASHKAENSIDKIDGPRKYELARATASPAKTLANTEWIFVREETTMSRSRPVEPGESLPYNHHLHQFMTFLKHERGFADAVGLRLLTDTIVRVVYPGDVLSGIPARGKYPLRRTGHPLGKDPAALRSEIQLSPRSA